MSVNQEKDALRSIHQVYFMPKRFKRFAIKNSKSFFLPGKSFYEYHTPTQHKKEWVE